MKYRLLLPLILAFPLLSGCVFESYRPVAEYDLPAVKLETKPAVALHCYEFRNESSAGTRFLYREDSGRVEKDPYHCWVLPPAELLPRALNLTFGASGVAGTPVTVNGTLEVFETERSSNSFRIAGTFQLAGKNDVHRFDFTAPLRNSNKEATVVAAGECVKLLAEKIAGSGSIQN